VTHDCLVCSGWKDILVCIVLAENIVRLLWSAAAWLLRYGKSLANLRDFLPADLNPKMHSLELIIIAIEHVSFVSESHIRSGPIHVEFDYASGEKKDKLQDYGQVKIPKAGERFVRRIVDSLESMQFTPLCHTDPIRAELELQEFGRAHFVENWDVQRNSGCKCISVPLITFTDGFGLYRNSYRSLMGFYQTPAALSFSDRNRRANADYLGSSW
jgi:hypothetical protein